MAEKHGDTNERDAFEGVQDRHASEGVGEESGATPEVRALMKRRRFMQTLTAGAAFTALGGGMYLLARDDLSEAYRSQKREDGRPRLPAGQKVIEKLRPMGGDEGSSDPADVAIRISGKVERPFSLNFGELVESSDFDGAVDVHCVTGWSVMDAKWKGVRLSTLAERAGVTSEARHVIFHANAGYTANTTLEEALKPDVFVAYELDGERLPNWYGGPVRVVVPQLYFWKSAKWLTGIEFAKHDRRGYWEERGYHNHADPWLEERYA